MRRIFRIAILLTAATLAATGYAEIKRPPAPPSVPDPKTGEQAFTRNVHGLSGQVDGSTLTIHMGDAGHAVLIPTDEKTVILINGQKATLDQIKPGMGVDVTQINGLTTRIEARHRGRASAGAGHGAEA